MTVTVGATGLLIDGGHLPVYSGAVHYWRLDRQLWPAVLDKVKVLGFELIETYIPWSVHETSPGVFDWGRTDPRKDVEAFMRLCEEYGMKLLARPGPLINAELTDFGFPEWVLLDPEVQACTALGTVHLDAAWGLHPPQAFPVPSYASERFFELSAAWYDAVCPIIARHLAPTGCVVAVQSDNETCYLFFDQAYATDYSADSLRLYRAYLRELHGSIDVLNAVYGTRHTSFDEVEPPRDGPIQARERAPWHLDWIAYKEYQIRWSVARFARMLRERGVASVLIFHDVAYQYRTPIDIARMEVDPDVDWVGLNLYRPPWEHAPLADRARFLSGSTKLPFVPELGAGIWSHHPATPTPEEQEFVNLSVLMYGIKAFSFYMLVERDRWQGSPITRHAELRPEYAPFYAQFLRFLRSAEFWDFARRPQALVLLNYDLGRFEAANSTLNLGYTDLYRLPPELFLDRRDLGLKWDVLADSWLVSLKSALRATGVDYDLADSHVPVEHLRRYPVVFLQSADFLDAADQRRLVEFVAGGGQLIVGPAAPYLDAYLQPCETLSSAGGFRIASEADLRSVVAEVVGEPEFRADDSRVEVVPHYNGTRTLLFVSNPTPEPISARILLNTVSRLTEVWPQSSRTTQSRPLFAPEPNHSDAPPHGERAVTVRASGASDSDVASSLRISLQGYTVQVWEVERTA